VKEVGARVESGEEVDTCGRGGLGTDEGEGGGGGGREGEGRCRRVESGEVGWELGKRGWG